ncbi:iron-sulfur cluster assembly scaffold protein [Alteromonas sp. ASW11-130]|uniref:iron-sulfur cluster assembly scaffold protein n=1 Tax=Alteromonas sp. ASW11-130 TaxID=3015775 RepID=UPI002242A1B5|nr:iron-sulfur cluster assembly scaffold protein [Alteromonas sp. ASW11-130]MCW8093459.1 iron-sulfur cluster assembly scaffold protein [Alteromonas sp. ASW11-130]
MYNDIIVDNFSAPNYVGDLETADHEIEIGNPVCGDRIKVQLLISDSQISKAVFRAWGCATSLATANVFCRSIEGQSITTISKRCTQEISSMLGELEPSQRHCLDILSELHSKLVSQLDIGVA